MIICSPPPLSFIFRYLNQQHIKKQKVSEAEILYGNGGHLSVAQEQMEIGELGLDIWRLFMIQYLGESLVKQILQGIERDRLEGNLTSKDIETINGDIHSFVMVQDYKKKGNLKLYENLFETKMLEASGEYFKSQASKLLQSCSVSQYMQEVLRILDEENIRAHKFMHISSIQKLKKECEDRMITDHKSFLYSECKDMVSNDKRDDLKNLYTLLKPITDGLKELIQFLLEQIKNEGTESVINLKGENVSSMRVMQRANNSTRYIISDSHSIRGEHAASASEVREPHQRDLQERSVVSERPRQGLRQRHKFKIVRWQDDMSQCGTGKLLLMTQLRLELELSISTTRSPSITIVC